MNPELDLLKEEFGDEQELIKAIMAKRDEALGN